MISETKGMISNSIVLVVINMSDNVKCNLVKPWEDYIGYHDCIDIICRVGGVIVYLVNRNFFFL